MFFDSVAEVAKIAARVSCGIFVANDRVEIPGAVVVRPEEGKKSIGIEEVRTLMEQAGAKQKTEKFFVIEPADAMTAQAQNALLKNLEEPKEHYHYVLLTQSPAALLPTILSRAQVFCQRVEQKMSAPVVASEKVKNLARELIAAREADLPEIAEKIAKDKNAPRLLALQVTAVAVEILEKSYFKTGNVAFMNKLPKFLALADALERNGNVKLHIVADLC